MSSKSLSQILFNLAPIRRASLWFMLFLLCGMQVNAQENTPLQQPAISVTLEFDSPNAESHLDSWIPEINQLLKNSFGESTRFKIEAENTSPQQEHSEQTLADSRINILIQFDGLQWTISARRRHELTDEWTAHLPVQAKSSDAVPLTITRMIQQLAPTTIAINDVDYTEVIGTLYGGEFETPDADSSLLKVGDLCAVHMLYFDKSGDLQQRQLVRWTYLEVIERTRPRIRFKVHSAFSNPIPRSRRRVEIYATRIRPLLDQTDLKVRIRGNPPRPFSLTTVYCSPWKKPDNESSIPILTKRTDRNGELTLSRNDIAPLNTDLIKLEVMSSDSVVARVPFIPGSQPNLDVLVPDDSARVQAQIDLGHIKTDLLKTVAKRATLIAVLKKIADSDSKIDHVQFFEQIEALPSQADFLKQVQIVEVTATERLNTLGNRVAARHVKNDCNASRSLITRFLDDEPLQELAVLFDYEPQE